MITLYFDIGTVADMVAICEETKRLGVYGEIRYRGGPPEEIYITKFFWWYFYGVPKGQDFARALTLELNKTAHRTENRHKQNTGLSRPRYLLYHCGVRSSDNRLFIVAGVSAKTRLSAAPRPRRSILSGGRRLFHGQALTR